MNNPGDIVHVKHYDIIGTVLNTRVEVFTSHSVVIVEVLSLDGAIHLLFLEELTTLYKHSNRR